MTDVSLSSLFSCSAMAVFARSTSSSPPRSVLSLTEGILVSSPPCLSGCHSTPRWGGPPSRADAVRSVLTLLGWRCEKCAHPPGRLGSAHAGAATMRRESRSSQKLSWLVTKWWGLILPMYMWNANTYTFETVSLYRGVGAGVYVTLVLW